MVVLGGEHKVEDAMEGSRSRSCRSAPSAMAMSARVLIEEDEGIESGFGFESGFPDRICARCGSELNRVLFGPNKRCLL